MQDSEPTDADLLAEWVRHQREPAFRELVARYAGLVHSVAKRTSGDDALAAEASQLSFILLARKARSLATRNSLAGWLHLTAVMQAKNLMRKSRRENRKRALLQTAMETEPRDHSDNPWREMQPVIDDALAALSDKDREALLLRFYRALTIREIAATLGIGADAAQKRIDRATGRLRGKLARRGCVAGGSLAAAILAGFATDSQAAVLPVSILTSKAVAAGTGGSGFITKILMTTTLKPSTLILPVIALVLSGAWIGTHRQSIHTLDRRSDLLEAAISAHASTAVTGVPTAKLQRTVGQKNGRATIDWNAVAVQLASANPPGQLNDMDQFMFEHRLGDLSKEDLLAGLDQISVLDFPDSVKTSLQETVVLALSQKDPEFTVINLIHRFQGTGTLQLHIAEAFKKWADHDFTKASGWMDEQIRAGTFDYKSLDGINGLEATLQGTLVRAQLSQPDGDAARRLKQVPEDQRGNFLIHISWPPLNADELAPFAELVRTAVPAASQAKAFSAVICRHSENLSDVVSFLDGIKATPEERAVCIGGVAAWKILGISLNREVTHDDVVGIREWVGQQVPEAVDRFTGQALDEAVKKPGKPRGMAFSDVADLALEFISSGNEEVLAVFLQGESARSNKALARSLADKIIDEVRRAEVMKNLN